MVFSVGRRRIAARAEEVGGVWPWTATIPVPSETPFIQAVMRRGQEIFPVYDLAGRLNVTVRGNAPLCVIAKRHDGTMAIRVDEDIPSLRTVVAEDLRLERAQEPDQVGVCRIDQEDVPVYSLRRLGLTSPG
ncbi:MAG: chemotaxis protein CheW [Nitrospirales bacterium]